MRLALWGRGPEPPELSKYKVDAAFWKHLGISSDRLDAMVEEEVRRDLVIMDEVARWEEQQTAMAAERARRQQRG